MYLAFLYISLIYIPQHAHVYDSFLKLYIHKDVFNIVATNVPSKSLLSVCRMKGCVSSGGYSYSNISAYIFHYCSCYFLPTLLFHLMRFFSYFLFLCRLFSFLLYLSPHTQLAFPHLQMNANLYNCIYYILSCFFLYDVIGIVLFA